MKKCGPTLVGYLDLEVAGSIPARCIATVVQLVERQDYPTSTTLPA